MGRSLAGRSRQVGIPTLLSRSLVKSGRHQVLPHLSVSYPCAGGTLPMHYSPFRRSTGSPKGTFARDLHVLAMPPAFVLSQDQTLQLIYRSRATPKGDGRVRQGDAGTRLVSRVAVPDVNPGRLNSKSWNGSVSNRAKGTTNVITRILSRLGLQDTQSSLGSF